VTKLWQHDAWDDYLNWQTQDKKTLNVGRIIEINRKLCVTGTGFSFLISSFKQQQCAIEQIIKQKFFS
jgi:hypothetical protein